LDSENETVFVNIDLPISFKSDQNSEVSEEEGVKNLVSEITNNILEDVLVVRKTFKDCGLTAYDRVEPNICFVTGHSKKDSEEIAGMISDLGVVFSPNTSKVIEKALDSITSICNIDFGKEAEKFENQMGQLLSYLGNVLDKRPCHVGLRKITKAAEEVFNKRSFKNAKDKKNISVKAIKDCQKAIHKKLDEIIEKREGYLKSLYNKCKDNLLDDFENIILFAYSETVTKFLDVYSEHHPLWKDRVQLYVLECSGKRRFTSNNSIEYNDGIYYAFQLSKHGLKNIKLLPDTSFSSLACCLKEKGVEKKSLVLFGVNGIDKKSKDCGHTSGHLMIAIVADHFDIPVKVIADSFKIGEIVWRPTFMREGPWLTGERDMLRDIKKHNITLTNYVEDRIPIGLIDEIVKDGKNISRRG
jgi:translation initiation factor 2B subunit (eIF-2B alpha/beta/delta family)